MQRFAIGKWGLVYWEVGRDKVVNECKRSKILLDDDEWDHVIELCDHNITVKKLF